MAKAPDRMVVPVTIDLELNVTGTIESTNFDDVGDFHEKFDLVNMTHMHEHEGVTTYPHLLPDDLYAFRYGFLAEELQEFKDAHLAGDLAGAFDALLDLVYVALGTAHLMELPWQEGWDAVQDANMAKERATSAEQSTRLSAFDVIKPPGWTPPDIEGILGKYAIPVPIDGRSW